MSRSDTGFAPCNFCPDNTLPYHFVGGCCYWGVMSYSPTNPCYCKANYRSSNGLEPCQECSPGSYTLSAQAVYYGVKQYKYATGSTTCQCMQGYISPTGTDSNGPCEKCPFGTSTLAMPYTTDGYIMSGGIFFVFTSISCNYYKQQRHVTIVLSDGIPSMEKVLVVVLSVQLGNNII